MNVMPGTFAVDSGTDTTKLTADVGMLGTDDGMTAAVAAAVVTGAMVGIGMADNDAVDGAVDGALLPKEAASADGCKILPGGPLLNEWLWMTFGVLLCNG